MAVTFKKAANAINCTQAFVAEGMKAAMAESVAAVKKLTLGGGKVSVSQDSVSVDVPSASVDEVLAAVGLIAPPKPPRIEVGDSVKVGPCLFGWVPYKEGDVGVVSRVWSPIKEALVHGDRYGLLEVSFGGVKHLLHHWEVVRVA